MTPVLTALDDPGTGPAAMVKDTIDIAGWPTRAGSPALADAPPAHADAEVVARLRRAGWRIVAKTKLHELAFGTTGLNAHDGTPTNPRWPERVPGGSSSGSAAAVAAGLAPLALGTDTGGSVRVPAACCGVIGFKPTRGLVSRRGVMPAASSLDCVGPFARDMATIVRAMQALVPGFALPVLPRPLRVGVLKVDATPAVQAAVDRALAIWCHGGDALLAPVEGPGLAQAYDAGLAVINAENWASLGHLVATGRVGADVAQRLRAASQVDAAAVTAAEVVREQFTAEIDALLAAHHVLALPTLPDVPPRVADAADTRAAIGMTALVRPFNLSGHPAISLPIVTEGGLPAGLQLVGRRGDDAWLCAVAARVMACLVQARPPLETPMPTLAETRPPTAAAPHPPAAPDDSFDALLRQVRERRHEFGRQRHISADVIEAFKRHGIYRALVPRRLGGEEQSPRYFCERIERIAEADGSAGWVASFGMGITYLAGLPLATLKALYAESPDRVFAGAIFPPQPARAVAGGLEVSGRWSFASGCMAADVVGVGIVAPGASGQPLPRIAVMPREQVQIAPNWDVIGMAGTGSHDIVVDRAVVPEAWTFIRGGKATLDEPMFRYPSLSFATQVLAVVGLGMARGAIEEVRGIATGRISITGAPKLADRPAAQMEIARGDAQLRAARAFFYEAMDDAWASLLRGDPVSREQTRLLRLSSTHAARASAEVVRAMQMLTGMTGIYASSPLSTAVCDSLVLTQHAFMGDVTYQNAGAMLFGLDPLPGYL